MQVAAVHVGCDTDAGCRSNATRKAHAMQARFKLQNMVDGNVQLLSFQLSAELQQTLNSLQG